MLASAGQSIAGILLAFVLLAPVSVVANDLRSAGNAQFEIVGMDDRSVSYVEELSKHVVEVAARYLSPDRLQFRQRILVSLKPEKYVDFEGDYVVRVGSRGFVNLDLRWEESLSLLTTTRALAEALLVRYSIFNYGGDGPSYLPEWPITAIGTKAYLILRPAQSELLQDWLKPGATRTVQSLLQRKWSDLKNDLNGYALLLALEQRGVDRKRVSQLMAQAMAGADIRPMLQSLVYGTAPDDKAGDLDAWWRQACEEIIAPQPGMVETMEASRLWIEALGDLSDTEIPGLDLRRLWKERENDAVRSLIEARYEILKIRILRVNPAYFNAARSLGALYEVYLKGEKRHKFIHGLTTYLGDFEDGKALEETVRESLSEAAGKSLGQ